MSPDQVESYVVPPYPPGVEDRPRRPRRDRTGAGLGLGALFGGLLGGPPGAALGAMLGHGAEDRAPFPLLEALQAAFATRHTILIQLYRHGPFALEALFQHGGEHFTLVARAEVRRDWQQIDLDDWLYGELVLQLDGWIRIYGVRLL